MRLSVLSLSVCACFLTGPSVAHELWLEPLDYTIDIDASIQALMFNGQGFGGTVDGEIPGAVQLPFLSQRNAAFRYYQGEASAPVDGRQGQSPAVEVFPLSDGLHSVAYVSSPSTLSYSEWARFQTFIDHKDLGGDLRDLHDARGLDPDDFTEVYIRHSKTLVAVGSGAGEDLRAGMEVELVALDNPYTDDLSDGLRVALYFRREVQADTQIELFEKGPDDVVTITFVRTDAEGIAVLPVRPGYSYMADAVYIREPSEALAEASDGAVWETLWANLTFEVPAPDGASDGATE